MKSLLVLHSALCLGATLVIILLYFVLGTNAQPLSLTEKMSLGVIIPLVIAFISIFLANYSFKKKVKQLGSNQITDENFRHYTAAYIVQWALLESAVLINVLVFFFFTNHLANLLIALITLLFLFLKKPKISN